MTLVFRSTTIHQILCINITTRSVSTVHPSSSVLHILKSPLNLNSPDVTKFSFSTQHCQRNVTTRCNIVRDLNSTAILDFFYKSSSNISQAQAADFLCFLKRKGARDRSVTASRWGQLPKLEETFLVCVIYNRRSFMNLSQSRLALYQLPISNKNVFKTGTDS